jgi:hypothetical protein
MADAVSSNQESVYKSKEGKELVRGSVVLVPCRVIKLGGNRAPLVHLETVEAYGHNAPSDHSPLKGRTKTAFWAAPDQLSQSAPTS